MQRLFGVNMLSLLYDDSTGARTSPSRFLISGLLFLLSIEQQEERSYLLAAAAAALSCSNVFIFNIQRRRQKNETCVIIQISVDSR